MLEQIINLDAMEQAVSLFGSFDENIKIIEKEFDVSIISRGSSLKVVGEAENVSLAVRAVNSLLVLINKGETLSEQNIRYAIGLVREGNEDKLSSMSTDTVCITSKGKPVKAKTLGQKKYCETIPSHSAWVPPAPAKPILPSPWRSPLSAQRKSARSFLPDLPWRRVKNSAFCPVISKARWILISARFMTRCLRCSARKIFRNIILDEAQNTTPEQMKMFLTRLGFNSKMVVTGDITQIDLPTGKKSGLKRVLRILKNVDDIEICRFSQKDVVRHRLVQEIIKAYEKYESEERK